MVNTFGLSSVRQCYFTNITIQLANGIYDTLLGFHTKKGWKSTCVDGLKYTIGCTIVCTDSWLKMSAISWSVRVLCRIWVITTLMYLNFLPQKTRVQFYPLELSFRSHRYILIYCHGFAFVIRTGCYHLGKGSLSNLMFWCRFWFMFLPVGFTAKIKDLLLRHESIF